VIPNSLYSIYERRFLKEGIKEGYFPTVWRGSLGKRRDGWPYENGGFNPIPEKGAPPQGNARSGKAEVVEAFPNLSPRRSPPEPEYRAILKISKRAQADLGNSTNCKEKRNWQKSNTRLNSFWAAKKSYSG